MTCVSQAQRSPSLPAFFAGSSLPRFSDNYALTLRVNSASASAYVLCWPQRPSHTRSTSSVGAFITEDGFLVEAAFEKWVNALYVDVLAQSKKKER